MVAITAAEVVFNRRHQTAIAEPPTRRVAGRAYGVVAFVQMVGIALAPLFRRRAVRHDRDHHLAMWMTIGGDRPAADADAFGVRAASPV